LFPLFETLCNDNNWGVRKACVESIAVVSQNISQNVRKEKLTTIFYTLIEDSSRFVRSSAFKSLGPLIATFPKGDVDNKLLSYYTSMTSEELKEGDIIDGLEIFCAYNFPAVLLTAGSEKWPELKNVHLKLIAHEKVDIRSTLSHSLHCISSILGKEITEEELTHIFDLFYNDVEEVKIGILKSMYLFLEILSENTRMKYLENIKQIYQSDNWRYRKAIANQFDKILKLYSFNSNAMYKILLPIVYVLLNDSIAIVRDTIQSKIWDILELVKEEMEREKFLNYLSNLSQSNRYHMRILFSKICVTLKTHLENNVYENLFLNPLLKLCFDKVPNVRLTISKSLSLLHKLDEENEKNISRARNIKKRQR